METGGTAQAIQGSSLAAKHWLQSGLRESLCQASVPASMASWLQLLMPPALPGFPWVGMLYPC